MGTQILATRAFQKLIESTVKTRLIGHFRFKGFDRIVEVHELLDEASVAALTQEAREQFRNGLFHFQRSEWEQAIAAFEKAATENPSDGPAKFYLMMIPTIRNRPRKEDWQGEIDLEEK